MAEKTDIVGLGDQPKKDWPKAPAGAGTERPIDLLDPKEKVHGRVLTYLTDRIKMSEDAMQAFYPRWRISEIKAQAYVDLPDYEKVLKQLTDEGGPPKAVTVVVPYMFATIATIVTYLIHTFGGRKPIFQVASNKSETVDSAQNMEIVMQYYADVSRLIRHLFQYFTDGELYGLGVLRTQWKRDTGLRTVWREERGFLGMGSKKVRVREERLIFEGSEVHSIDPYLFFPDPRVPISQVNTRGEFVFWRDFVGKHTLKRLQQDGKIKWLEFAGNMPRPSNSTGSESARAILSGGEATPGSMTSVTSKGTYYQVDQGTIDIVPAELGLSSSDKVERWIFTILNKTQIVQAQPYEHDHGKHPVAVIEPYNMGYGFGQPGLGDYLGSIQDTISWFINSHVYNVRTALNNMFVVDPSMIELQDLKEPEPGKIIRLKRAAYGQDVRTILQQLQVSDVTGSHVRDTELFMRMGDALSSVNDNLRALQDSGGRKTATEVRLSGEAGASRLAAHARLISAQGIVDLTEQWCLDTQQFLSDEMYLGIVGQKGNMVPIHISPEMVVGSFHYPIHDGTLPLDRVAMLDVWKEIFLAVSADQELRAQFSVPNIFEWVAELGGAKNIDRFKINVQPMPTEQVMDQAAGDKLMPVPTGAGPRAREAGMMNV